ncbi:probable glutamate receptor [Gouania willdenowi]|uniref:Glutamate receptor n=1 Tax=Gouania willdenowi TaxID=441366 RepID=A0A8C5EM13_GOUWI|nr:probable glutamate receptor [Gouania willdenowi]XP_028308244.1 probable glutamate receptor [Gouania willdenowi]
MKVCLALCFSAVALTAFITTADAKELLVTTIKEEPYVMSRGSELEGYCVDLIEQLSKKLGFQYKLHLVKDSRYGAIDSKGNWNGMIGEIVRGEADLAVAPLTLTARREQFVDMTAPFMQTGLSFILHKDIVSDGDSAFSLLSPFSTDTWVGVLIAFLMTVLCIFLVSRISPSEWAEPGKDEQHFTLLHSIWYITGAFTLQGAGPHPRALSGRVISAIWWISALLLLASYFGNLHTTQHSNSHGFITSFEDLAKQDVIDYGTIDGGSTMSFFKTSTNPVHQRMYQHMERMKSFVPNLEEGVRRTREGNFAFIGEAVSLDLIVARNCDLTRSQDIISMKAYTIAAPQGSQMVKNLTIAILQLSESGELTYLRDKWWASSCIGSDEAHSSKALQPQDLRSIFLLLGLGLCVGMLLSLLELLSRARESAKDSKKSCCSELTSELNQRFSSNGSSAEANTSDQNKV